MDNYTIIKKIAGDLKIRRATDEIPENFLSRIVYSALSMWIRYSTLDEDILSQSEGKIGVSKVHILNRCQLFLDNMINIYPSIEKWFYPAEQSVRPIELVRDRLYQSGELVDVGFDTDLALPHYEECLINTKVLAVRGLQEQALNKVTGLAQVKYVERNDTNFDSALEFYGLRNMSASTIVDEYLKLAKWSERSELNAQLFNKYSVNTFSNSWESELKLKDNDITVYRNPLYRQGNRDYGFVKRVKNNYGSSLYWMDHLPKDSLITLYPSCRIS